MQRDMDLIRTLMLEVESEQQADLSSYDEKVILYHRNLLIDAGLAKGFVLPGDGVVKYVELKELTWDGHEFLDAARSEKGWKYVMKQIATTLGTASLPVIQSLLVDYAREAIKRGH